MVVILALGIFLRIYPSAGFSGLGVDERGYMVFLKQIQRAGLTNYDSVVRVFVEKQYHRPDAVVPATRIGFLAPAYLCGKLFHLSNFAALRGTACAASSLTLILCTWFGFRLGGRSALIGGLAEWARFYLMFEAKSRTDRYSVYSDDGPWFRYLVGFTLVALVLVALAVVALFHLRKADRPAVFMATFLVLSFTNMSVI